MPFCIGFSDITAFQVTLNQDSYKAGIVLHLSPAGGVFTRCREAERLTNALRLDGAGSLGQFLRFG